MNCNNFYTTFYNTSAPTSNEHISTIIGGLFGLTLVSLTVFSLISNIMDKKSLGMSPTVLNRYNVFVLLSPLYILITYLFLMTTFLKCLDNIYCVVIFAIFITIYVTIQALYILQPFYNKEEFLKHLIKKQMSLFKKKYKKNKENLKEVYNYLIEKLENLKDYKLAESFFNKKEIIIIWIEYLKTIDALNIELSKEFKNELVRIGANLLEDDIINIIENKAMLKEELVEYIIRKKSKEYNNNYFEFVFYSLHDLLEQYQKEKLDLRIYNEISIEFLESIFGNRHNINLLFEIILDQNWNIKDAEYLSLYIQNIILNSKYENYVDIYRNEYVQEGIEYILNCSKNDTKFSKLYGEDYDELIKSCLVFIKKRKSENDEENNIAE